MKGVILPQLRIGHRNSSFYRLFLSFFLIPVKSGLFGFAIFFTILLLVKATLMVFNNGSVFLVSVEDVALSLIGFFSLCIVRIFKNLLGGK